MAATLLTPRGNRTAEGPPPRQPIPKSSRLEWREAYGAFPSLMRAGEEESAAGQHGNALTAYQYAMSEWLRGRWVEQCGKPGSPITDAATLANKLRSGLVIDSWLYKSIVQTLERPQEVDRRHVEIITAVISSLSLEPRRTVGGDQCIAD